MSTSLNKKAKSQKAIDSTEYQYLGRFTYLDVQRYFIESQEGIVEHQVRNNDFILYFGGNIDNGITQRK